MRYGKPTLRNSFFGWLGVADPGQSPAPAPAAAEVQAGTLCLREHMLALLPRNLDDPGVAGLACRLRRAPDALSLWYCRSELMQLLCLYRGEAGARAGIDGLAPLFKGLVPAGMTAARTQGLRR